MTLVDRFQKVVGSIITLVEPLPFVSLARMIGIPIGQMRAALAKLPSVISIPENAQDTPQIYHPSFPDFLKDPTRCTDSDLLIIPSAVHTRLASNCLRLMRSDLKRDICNIADPTKLNDQVEGLKDRIGKAILPCVRYACLHWSEHVSNAKVGDPEVKEQLEWFCRHGVMYWLEALSLLGSLEKGAPFLEHVREWAVSKRTIFQLKHF